MGMVYMLIAVLGALLFAAAALRMIFPLLRASDDTEPLPLTPLQKRSWLGLATAALVSVAVLVVLMVRGPTAFFEDTTTRLLTDGLLLGGLIVYFVLLRVTRLSGADLVMDERDVMILGKTARLQLTAVLLGLLVWAIALTEVYWEQKSVPLAFVYLIFLSSMIVNFLAMPIGVLLGYRWARLHGQG